MLKFIKRFLKFNKKYSKYILFLKIFSLTNLFSYVLTFIKFDCEIFKIF